MTDSSHQSHTVNVAKSQLQLKPGLGFCLIMCPLSLSRLDIPFFMAGVLGSLVSITAICGVVKPGESLAIGFVGSAIAIFGWQLLNKIHIDDPVGAVSTHAGGSIWGMIAVGLFVEKDSLEKPFSSTYGAFKGGHVRILGVQLLACVSITAWTLVTVFIQLYVIDKSVGLRLPLEEEILGADACEHGIDQSQLNTECHVMPVPASRNRVFPEKINEGQENAGTSSNDNSSNIATNETHCENRIDDSEKQDYQEPDAISTSNDTPERNKSVHQSSLNSSEQTPCQKNSNNFNGSAKKKWGRIVLSRRQLNRALSEKQKVPKGSSLKKKKKAPVIITLTPADDDRAFRLSVSDLRN